MSRDVLEQLLTTLDVRVHAFALCEVERGRRLQFDAAEAVIVHFVLGGSGWLKVKGAAPVAFEPKSVLVVPPGRAQALSVSEEVEGVVNAERSCRLLSGGLLTFDAAPIRVDLRTVCGTITATYAGGFGLFDNLSGPLVEPVGGTPLLAGAIELMLEEIRSPGLGGRALIEGLMKQVLLLVLRSHLNRHGDDSPLFAAFGDPRLVRAVAAIIERPAAQHTLQSLASEAGMSRSVFVARFSRTFGQSPIEFVQKLRLRHAAHLLRVTDLPVKVVADAVGYFSRSHFSRAFKASFGLDPTAYRKQRARQDGLVAPLRSLEA